MLTPLASVVRRRLAIRLAIVVQLVVVARTRIVDHDEAIEREPLFAEAVTQEALVLLQPPSHVLVAGAQRDGDRIPLDAEGNPKLAQILRLQAELRIAHTIAPLQANG